MAGQDLYTQELGPVTNVANSIDTVSENIPKRNTFKTIFRGNPGKAALYSLLIPAGGQVYNRKWWKVPLALGVDGYFTWNLIQQNRNFNKYDQIVNNYNLPTPIPDPEVPEASARNFRSQARTNKEYALVYLIVGHLVTVFDAYVDRHLLDFDISDDLSTFYYKPTQPYIQIASIAFPLH
ncbi:MAG: hypothetical protein IPN29_10880 [Saprospiraceae bacterium]|nr:hypothetical protein [Saprospiraceae bacterium]